MDKTVKRIIASALRVALFAIVGVVLAWIAAAAIWGIELNI